MQNEPAPANEAIKRYQNAIATDPENATAHYNLGNELAARGLIDKAIQSYQKAIALKPDHENAHYNLGNTFAARGKISDAIGSYQAAIAIKPDFAEAYWNLFELLTRQGNFAEAREAAQRYIQLCADSKKILPAITLVSTYLKSGLSQAAQDEFIELENLVYQSWDKLEPPEIERIYTNILFELPYLRDDVAANAKLAKFIGKLYTEKLLANRLRNEERIGARAIAPDGLRIGFLSPHLWRHSVGWCSADIIQELSRLTPHIYLYVTNPDEFKSDDRTQLFTKVAAQFYQGVKLSNGSVKVEKIIEKIGEDRLDILIDMDSVMLPVHGEILYSQPAPVCISWLGFDAPYISEKNYYLGDGHTHPPEIEPHYTEQIVRMPDSFAAVSGFVSAAVNREAMRRSLRISTDQVVYLCVAPGSKFNSELAKAQVQILKQVPDSVLLHKGKGDRQVIQAMYKQECEAQGVGFYRLKFLERSRTEEEHRTIYQIADVLLDSYPYNGGTHNLEALWFNLPLVTRAGDQALSRMGYSFLKTLEIEAGIAHSWEEYVEWGIRFGKDSAFRNEIRDRLLKAKQPDSLAPLWNPKKFASDMYAVFEELLARTASDRPS